MWEWVDLGTAQHVPPCDRYNVCGNG